MQRSEQFKACADLSQEVYKNVHDQDKTQTQRRNAKLICAYSLTAPADIPLIIYFTRQKYSTIMGIAMNIEPAANRANSVSPSDIRPTATVYRSLSIKSILGKMKSDHGQVNEVSAVYTSIGFDSGRMNFTNTVKLDAPSILAASSID